MFLSTPRPDRSPRETYRQRPPRRNGPGVDPHSSTEDPCRPYRYDPGRGSGETEVPVSCTTSPYRNLGTPKRCPTPTFGGFLRPHSRSGTRRSLTPLVVVAGVESSDRSPTGGLFVSVSVLRRRGPLGGRAPVGRTPRRSRRTVLPRGYTVVKDPGPSTDHTRASANWSESVPP